MSTTTGAKLHKDQPQPRGALDAFFYISERGSTVGTEVRAGVVTFFAMAYIVLLNPLIIGTSPDREGVVLGIPQVAAATALAAGVMSILFGVIAKYPFGIATGLGINTLVAVTMVGQQGLTWPEAMGLVVIDGIIIVLLAVSGFRTAVFNAIPFSMKVAMSVGIGMFIATIGLVDAGFVRRVPDSAMTTVPVQLGTGGSIASWPTFVFIVGLVICGFMVVRQIRGGLFIGIVATTVIAMIVEALTGAGSSADNPEGWNLAVPSLPDSFGGVPDLSIVGNVNLVGAFTHLGVIAASMLVFTLVLANFFDAMGTMTALGRQANLTDEQERDPGYQDQKGHLVTLEHTQSNWFGGYNKLALQYGTDGIIGSSGRNSTGNSDGKMFRLVNQGVVGLTDNIEMMYVQIYEDRDFDNDSGQTWASFGVRPVYKWSDVMSTALEFGYDRVDPQADGERTRVLVPAADGTTREHATYNGEGIKQADVNLLIQTCQIGRASCRERV